jgi:predicted amidohydrolase YtcJ
MRGMTWEKADTLLVNGKILTVDAKDAVTEAIAIKNGRILAVSTTSDIMRHRGDDSKIIDLEGKTVTPGLVDSHNHHSTYGFSKTVLNLRYPEVKSIRDIKRLVAQEAKQRPPGAWIVGGGWDEASLEEKRRPTIEELDEVAPNNPVTLNAQAAFCVANSLAIKLAGGDPSKENPDKITWAVYHRIETLAKTHTTEEIEEAILKAQQGLFEVGVTAQKDAGTTAQEIEAFKNLHARKQLKIRSALLFVDWEIASSIDRARTAVAYSKTWGDDVLALRGAKCSYDGSGGNRTAWLYEEWNKNYVERDPLNHGSPSVSDPHMHGEAMKLLHRAGLQFGAHCIGDQTIDRFVDEIEAAVLDTPRSNCRHSVMHCNLPTEHALNKMQRLGDNVVVEANPAYIYFLGDLYAGNFGSHRSRRMIPLKTMIERGLVVGAGADYVTCDVNPLYGLYAACTRRPRRGVYGPQPFGVDECITIQQALRLYTINSAYCMFWEKNIGSLEAGKYADLVVWSGDLYQTPPEKLLDLKVLMTMVNGEIVYEAK